MFLSLGKIVESKGVEEPIGDLKTIVTHLKAKARLPEGLAVHLQPRLTCCAP